LSGESWAAAISIVCIYPNIEILRISDPIQEYHTITRMAKDPPNNPFEVLGKVSKIIFYGGRGGLQESVNPSLLMLFMAVPTVRKLSVIAESGLLTTQPVEGAGGQL